MNKNLGLIIKSKLSNSKIFLFSLTLSLVRILAGFLILKLIAVIGGSPAIAIYSQAQSTAIILNGIISSSSGNGTVKLTSQYRDDPNLARKIQSHAFIVMSSLSFFVIFVIFVIHDQFLSLINLSELNIYYLLFYALCSMIASTGMIFISICNGYQKSMRVIFVNISGICCALLITSFLIIYSGLDFIIIIPGLYLGVVGLIQIILLTKFLFTKASFNFSIEWSILKKFTPFIFMAVTSLVLSPLTLIIVRRWLIEDFGLSIAGDWEAARKLIELSTLALTGYFAIILIPKLSRLQFTKDIRFEIFQASFFLLILLFLWFSIVFILKAPVFKFIFSEGVEIDNSSLLFRMLGEVFRNLNWLLGIILIINANSKIYIYTSISYTFILLILTNILLNRFGLVGVNISYLITNFIMFFVMLKIFMDETYQLKHCKVTMT